MQAGQSADLHTLASLPGYRAILRTVLKSQIKQLVEQLSYFAGEEAILLSASLSDGTLSHVGSQSGEIFLNTHEKVKSQFLGFCMKRHAKQSSTTSQSQCARPESPKQAKLDEPGANKRPLTNEDYINFLSNLSEKAIAASNNLGNPEDHHAAENHENHEENKENPQEDGEGECEVTGEAYEYSMDTCYDVDADKKSPVGAEGEEGEKAKSKPDVLIIKEEPVDDSYAAASSFDPGSFDPGTVASSLSVETNKDLLAMFARKKPQRRRLSFASIERKYWAVLDAEAGKKKKEIATELNIPQSTLSTWIKSAEKIKESYLTQDYSPNRKRCRSSKFPDIDAKLLEWTRESKVLEMELPKQVLMAKANEVARGLGYTEQQFTCSWSWVERFKARYGLAVKPAPDPYE